MLCHKCKEQIEVGEACRAEPTEAGGNHHRFYHCGCYQDTKCERQLELPLTVRQREEAVQEDEAFEHIARMARVVC